MLTMSKMQPQAGLDQGTYDKLMQVSTATLTTALFRRGLRNIFLQGPQRLSDGPNMWPLHLMAALLSQLQHIDQAVKSQPFGEDQL